MKLLVKALHHDRDFHLALTLVAGEKGLDRQITHPRVQKPGLALAGFVESLRENRIQVFGRTEIVYLSQLDAARQQEALEQVLSFPIACVVITAQSAPPNNLVDTANRCGVPVFCTPLTSGKFIRRVQELLDTHLSPETSLHGVLLDVYGVGVLLTGPSGIGKSECALDLILRGHRLVGDDVVLVRRRGQELLGTGSTLTKHHMEVRGLGIINVQDLFGAASVRDLKRVELLVELSEWRADAHFDRMGIDDEYEEILEIGVPKISLPIRPGRNVASIVEVAARNHLLKQRGHHSARTFKEDLERRLANTVATESKP